MIRKSLLCTALSLMVATTVSCASRPADMDPHEDFDRFEPYNRAMFGFNMGVDKYVLKPVAKGYRAITNEFTRDRVNTTLANLKEPISAGNHLLQAEPQLTGVNIARFAINSTLGLFGMFDVADGWGLKAQRTGFDQTLATWCVPDGPYIVLPLMGASTPRAATGLLVDTVSDPVYWATYNDANIRDKVGYSYTAIRAISLREANIEFLDEMEQGSVDFYSTMRSAYLQNRSQMGCKPLDAQVQYDFDFGMDEEDGYDPYDYTNEE